MIIHQELALIPALSITENLFLGNEDATRGVINWLDARKRGRRAARPGRPARGPLTPIIRDIGIGKQQLVEIAKALAKDVKLLILDEPTAALNDGDSQHLLDLLGGLRDQGITCDHDQPQAQRDRADLRRHHDHPRRPHHRDPRRSSDGGVDEDRIIRGMVGRDLDHRYPPHEPDIGEVLLEIRDWTVMHPADPHRVVVDRANLTVRRGEIVGLAGPDGRRAHRARPQRLRPVLGHQAQRHPAQGRQGDHRARPCAQAIDAGLAYVTEDRKALGLNLLDAIKVSITSAGLNKIRQAA